MQTDQVIKDKNSKWLQKKNYLEHHGILGQKWGVRRFQNYDGSYTSVGLKRYGRSPKSTKNIVNTRDLKKLQKYGPYSKAGDNVINKIGTNLITLSDPDVAKAYTQSKDKNDRTWKKELEESRKFADEIVKVYDSGQLQKHPEWYDRYCDEDLMELQVEELKAGTDTDKNPYARGFARAYAYLRYGDNNSLTKAADASSEAYFDYVENKEKMIESAVKNALKEIPDDWSLKDDHPDQYGEKYFSTYVDAILSRVSVSDYPKRYQ